jgi:uncharacterized protein YjbI with pentapeptide repeats
MHRLLVFLLIFLVWLPQPSWAAAPQPDRLPLTESLLVERLKSLSPSEGVRTIDLRRLTIDLRPENEAFRNQFYRSIQQLIQRSPVPIGLDLSYSTILGELRIAKLGVQVPLSGQALTSILSPLEQSQLQRDRRRLYQLSRLSRSLLVQTQALPAQLTVFRGPLILVQTQFQGYVNFTNSFFLGRVESKGAIFEQDVDCSESRFSQAVNFAGTSFRGALNCRSVIFFDATRFNQAQFQGLVNLQSSEFQAIASFHQAEFQQVANWNRIQWQGNADFAQTTWHNAALFDRSTFAQSLFLTEAVFEKLVSFQQVQFNQPVNLRGAAILDQADFGDANFAATARLNVPDLQFNAEKSQILGNPGTLGRVLSVPMLQGNETLLRNLVRNFRQLEQIPDVNQLEYTREKLRLQELSRRLTGVNLNTATILQLQQIGFSPIQAEAIAQARLQHPFNGLNELLRIDEIDLTTYVKVRDRIVVQSAHGFGEWLGDRLRWLGLLLLISLTRYGTGFWLIFGIGLLSVAYFSLLFWLIDRLRRLNPTPIIPNFTETVWMVSSCVVLAIAGLSAVFRTSDTPWISLACLGVLIFPIPSTLLFLLYRQGRYHDLMEISYFVEDGSLRQLRLLVGRLPNIPSYPLFRERYTPISWEKRWNWLNYLDFSLNNLLKVGFNDIRLRDQHLPGLITSLVWYQWSLGLLYIALLFWTLSRAIPGLNLLIYLK